MIENASSWTDAWHFNFRRFKSCSLSLPKNLLRLQQKAKTNHAAQQSFSLGQRSRIIFSRACFRTMLYSIPIQNETLHYAPPHSTRRHYTILHYATLHHTTLPHSTLHHITLHFITLTLASTTIHYIVLK